MRWLDGITDSMDMGLCTQAILGLLWKADSPPNEYTNKKKNKEEPQF